MSSCWALNVQLSVPSAEGYTRSMSCKANESIMLMKRDYFFPGQDVWQTKYPMMWFHRTSIDRWKLRNWEIYEFPAICIPFTPTELSLACRTTKEARGHISSDEHTRHADIGLPIKGSSQEWSQVAINDSSVSIAPWGIEFCRCRCGSPQQLLPPFENPDSELSKSGLIIIV